MLQLVRGLLAEVVAASQKYISISAMSGARGGVVDKEEEYQCAVTALNGLQTSADILMQKRERRCNLTDSAILEQRRRDENYHRECQEKLRHVQNYLEDSGLKLADLDRLNAIHVTGTKGKGSVCAMCEIILRKHNLKTGFFSSPHLLEVRERIRLDGVPLSKAKFVAYFWECYNQLKKKHVDVAMVEVGIGGAYDCTNIIPKPAACAISSLGYDHMDILGETLEKIAWQKGGIFKRDCPTFTSPQFPGPMRVLQERATELGASSLHVAPPLSEYPSLDPPLRLSLAGNHQKANASLAVQVCRSWLQNRGKWRQDFMCSDDDDDDDDDDDTNSLPLMKKLHGVPVSRPFQLTKEFRQGLEQCWWPGRNQIIKKGRVSFYLDGAHTPQSVKACAEWFKSEAKNEADKVKGSVVRLLLFNLTKSRDPRLLMQPLLDCGFTYAAFTPNIASPQGTNSADQTNLTVSLSSQQDRTCFNHQTWLEVNNLLNSLEDIEASLRAHREGLVTSSPDPLTLCGRGNVSPSNFRMDNARVFSCISDAIKWCDPYIWTHERTARTNPDTSELGDAERIQVLVTGSLHLVGATMVVLGIKIEDLYKL